MLISDSSPPPPPTPPTTVTTPFAPGSVRLRRPAVEIGRATRWLAAAIIFFLADAVQLLLLLPDRTGRALRLADRLEVSSLVLGSAYVAGGYFFVRVLMADAGIASRPGSPPSSSSCGWRPRRRRCTSTASRTTGSPSPPGRRSIDRAARAAAALSRPAPGHACALADPPTAGSRADPDERRRRCRRARRPDRLRARRRSRSTSGRGR